MTTTLLNYKHNLCYITHVSVTLGIGYVTLHTGYITGSVCTLLGYLIINQVLISGVATMDLVNINYINKRSICMCIYHSVVVAPPVCYPVVGVEAASA